MEVITSISPLHYGIFLILGVISEIIVGGVIFKKIQKYRRHQFATKHNLNTDIDKIENAFNQSLRNLDDLEHFMLQPPTELRMDQMRLEIDSIREKIQHQLGHIPRMRSNLK